MKKSGVGFFAILRPAHSWKVEKWAEKIHLLVNVKHFGGIDSPHWDLRIAKHGWTYTTLGSLRLAASQDLWFAACQRSPFDQLRKFKDVDLSNYYYRSHLCSSPILNPQLAWQLYCCLHSKGLFHTSHALPENVLEDTKHLPHRRFINVAANATGRIFFSFSFWDQDHLVNAAGLKLYFGWLKKDLIGVQLTYFFVRGPLWK